MKSAREIVDGYKGGSLYLRGCDLSGVTLPQSIGGWIDLRGCDLSGVTLPQSIGGWIDLSGCENIPAILPACVEVIR